MPHLVVGLELRSERARLAARLDGFATGRGGRSAFTLALGVDLAGEGAVSGERVSAGSDVREGRRDALLVAESDLVLEVDEDGEEDTGGRLVPVRSRGE